MPYPELFESALSANPFPIAIANNKNVIIWRSESFRALPRSVLGHNIPKLFNELASVTNSTLTTVIKSKANNNEIADLECTLSNFVVGDDRYTRIDIRPASTTAALPKHTEPANSPEHTAPLSNELDIEHHTLLDNLPVGVGIANRKGHVVLFNKTLGQMFGFEMHEIPTLNDWAELAYPDPQYRSWVFRTWDSTVAKLLKFEIESGEQIVKITCKDKTIKTVKLHFSLHNNLILTVFNNITQLIKTEGELFQSNLTLKTILDTIPAKVFWKDTNLNYLGCNLPFAIDAGYKSTVEILGKSDFDLNKTFADRYRADDREVINSGKEKRRIEEPVIVHDVQAWIRTNKVPLKNISGEIIGVLGIYEDITNEKQAEIELKKYREGLEKLVKVRTAEVESANKELKLINIELNQTNQELEEQKEELEVMINELKETQTQLVHSEKMASVGMLTAGIAHEINNPINFISSGIQGLKPALNDLKQLMAFYNKIDAKTSPEQLGRLMENIQAFKEKTEYELMQQGIPVLMQHIETGIRRTAEIINSLRTFSRMDSKEKQLTDLHENIDSALVILHNQYKNRIEINKIYGDIPKIKCYPGQLNQVFMNLLINAIHAIAEEGEINIRTYLLPDPTPWAIIEIQDTGAGIPQVIMDQIYEPFFTTKAYGKGTGLGLSISYNIIQKHNGSINVDSEEGKGSCFKIRLPIA